MLEKGKKCFFPSPGKFDKEKCFPIRVPSGDPFWTGRRRKTCMSFARSLPSPGLKCGLQFRQQMNQVTFGNVFAHGVGREMM